MRTCEPSGLTLSSTLPNCFGVRSRVDSLMVAVSIWPGTAGVPPNWPAATWTFCPCSALTTSTGVRFTRVSLCGSSQMRMAYCVPNRSEEHTSELQSLMRNSYGVFCLKKKKKERHKHTRIQHRQTHNRVSRKTKHGDNNPQHLTISQNRPERKNVLDSHDKITTTEQYER